MTYDIRADILLVEQHRVGSRTQAQRLIAEKRVSYKQGGQWVEVDKPGLKLPPDTEFTLLADESDRFVSRGGLKLDGALSTTGLDVTGMIALDVGQSSGGFTDCLLQNGVAKVVGVDVGHDQLAPSLRDHEQVIYFEGVNARQLSADVLLPHTSGGRGFDLAVMDVSFISQTLILPSLVPLLKRGGHLISLVKPQFEVGKAGIGKGGLVRDAQLFHEVEDKIRGCCERQRLSVKAYFESPITGGDGNREFLIYAQLNGELRMES